MNSSEPITPDQSHAEAFSALVRARQSVRAFLPQPVPQQTIREVLEDAQWAPSNCNTQPWNVHIVSGASRERLSAALLNDVGKGRFSPDFSFSTKDYFGPYAERNDEQGRVRHDDLGIARDDAQGRMALAMQNYHFFNAPHVALLFMPSFGDCVRVGSDVGMYGQTFLLALAARGLGGVPQTSVGLLADTVREVLGVPDDLKLLFAISFGYPDPGVTKTPLGRAPLEANITFFD
jgi:nitroreductase